MCRSDPRQQEIEIIDLILILRIINCQGPLMSVLFPLPLWMLNERTVELQQFIDTESIIKWIHI